MLLNLTLSLILLFNLNFLFAGSLSEVKTKIEKKEYQQAFELSGDLLNKDYSASLLYNHILAAAGLNLNGALDEPKINSINSQYSEKQISTSDYKISSGECNTNCILFMKESPTELYMVITFPDNSGKPAIVLMVYITLKKEMTKSAFNKLNKRKAKISGELESVYLSGNLYKRLNLRINNAALTLE